MSANLEDPTVTTGLEKVDPYPNSKKGSTKKCAKHQTIALISQTGKIMLTTLHARLQHYVTQELPDIQAGLRKGSGTSIQIASVRWVVD